MAQLGPDQARPRPQADQRRGAHPPRLGGLRRRQAQVALDLSLPVGGLGALAGQRRRLGARSGLDARGPAPAGWSSSVRRVAGETASAAREHEALDRRLAKERLGLRLKPHRLAERSEAAGGIEQRLGPFARGAERPVPP